MADQDFDINIKTIADLTGVRKASDAIAILNEQAKRSQTEAGAGLAGPGGEIAGRIEHSFSRIAFHAIGAGLVLGAIEEIKRFAEEINKISDSLEKQGEALVKNVQLMSQEARFATTQADVIKVAETGMKGQAEQHKVVEELLKKELGWWETISDIISKIDPTLGPKVGPLQQVLDDALKSATELEEAQRESAIHNVQAAQIEESRHAAQSFSEQIDELNERIKRQEELQKRVGIENIESWTAIGQLIEKYKQQLADVTRQQEQFAKALEKSGGQDLAGKLTPGGEIGHLHQQLVQLSGLKNLTPAEEKAARDAFINTTKELRDKEIQAEKDSRDAQIKAQRDRYEGTNLPVRQPGESQSQFNAEVLKVLRSQLAAWQ